MPKLLDLIRSTNGFMPHGHCYLWDPRLVWLQVVSNGLIGLSYVAIASTLTYLVYRIRGLPFQRMYLAFGAFIIACGFTHFMDIWIVWNPIYWIDGIIRVITAIASIITAVILPSLVPKIVVLAQSAKVALDRGIKLETAHRELSLLFEKNKELDELKTQFFANMSHELRTPIALILGPVEEMRLAQNLTEDQKRSLEVILRNARLVLKHINDLLDISKLEAGRMHAKYSEIDISKLVRLTASNFDCLAKDKNIALAVNVPNTPLVQMDPDMIQRILVNLLSNAFKFTPKGGKIDVTLSLQMNRVLVSVQDNGPGIPNEMKEVVFERFRQIDGGVTRQVGGTGLGLSIAKELTELHGGKIQIQDALGGGSIFVVELPASAPSGVSISLAMPLKSVSESMADHAVEELKEVTRQTRIVAPAQGSEKGSVLIVEDNSDMNQFIADALSTQYRVITAFDGQEGLEKAISTRPDLILSDIMMPRMSGDQLVAEIRKRSEFENMPIIILTAKADDDLRVKLLSDGVQDYIIKPFSREEILARVKNLVTLKRARDALQQELSSQLRDLGELTQEVTLRRKELQFTAEKLRLAKEEAERSSQAKSIFLGLISHEMKTPITALQLQLELLKHASANNLTSWQRGLVDRLWRSSKRSETLVDSILEFVQFQSGNIQVKLEKLDLSAIVGKLVDSFQDVARDKKLDLRFMPVPQHLPSIQSDPVLVSIVIRNLIANAVNYTERGFVRISISFEKGEFRVVIEDSGPGIPLNEQERIFEPFEQLEPLEKKHKPGFGLGLSIAKQTIKLLGGRIELLSEVGKGSKFIVVLPIQLST